jgi:transcriptional regulator with XRE-family HTH domain
MTSTLVIPAEMVMFLRDGLLGGIVDASTNVCDAGSHTEKLSKPGWYREPLAYFDRHRVLLDLIGWEHTDTQVDVQIDLREHREAVLEALWSALNYSDDDLREGLRVEAERAKAGEPPQDATLTERVLALREWAAAVEAQASALASSSSPVTVHSSAEVGRAVRARRRELELSKKRLAELASVDRTAVSDLERDGDAPLGLALLILNVLGLDADLQPRRPSLSTILVVPPAMVVYLRESLHCELGKAGEEIAVASFWTDRLQHPECYEEPLAHLDRARALLDQIGWKQEPHEVCIDLREHQQAILEALRLEALVVEDQLHDAIRADAERGEPPQHAKQARRAAALREFVTCVEAQASALEPSRSPVLVHSPTDLGKEIRIRRRELRLSKKDLSNVTGVSPQIINELERDGSDAPLRAALLVVNTLGFDTELRRRGVTGRSS